MSSTALFPEPAPPMAIKQPCLGFADGELGLNEQGILVVEVGSSTEALQNTFAQLVFYWLEFERGSDGMFLLPVEQLRKISQLFKTAGK